MASPVPFPVLISSAGGTQRESVRVLSATASVAPDPRSQRTPARTGGPDGRAHRLLALLASDRDSRKLALFIAATVVFTFLQFSYGIWTTDHYAGTGAGRGTRAGGRAGR
jgi:hypothetical protein